MLFHQYWLYFLPVMKKDLHMLMIVTPKVIPPILPSRLGLRNTPTAPLQRGKTTPTSVLDMTLNNLMGRVQ